MGAKTRAFAATIALLATTACSPTGGTTGTPASSTPAAVTAWSSTPLTPTFSMRGVFNLYVVQSDPSMKTGVRCTGLGPYSYAITNAPVKVFDGHGHLLATGELGEGVFNSNPQVTICQFEFMIDGVPDGYTSYAIEIADQGVQEVSSSTAHAQVFLHDGL